MRGVGLELVLGLELGLQLDLELSWSGIVAA